MVSATKNKKDLLKELEETKDTVAKLSGVQATLVQQSANRAPVSGQVMVGIRNVSDTTLGVPGRFGEPDIHLHSDVFQEDPANVAIISYAWWRELRKSKYVAQGQIVRDDTILGNSYLTAPEDRPEDLPKDTSYHIIRNPVEWIERRTEAELRVDIAKVKYEATLRRIRRAVDMKLKELEAKYPGDPRAAVKAVGELSMKYKLVDELTTIALEKPEEVFDIPSKFVVTRDGLKEI